MNEFEQKALFSDFTPDYVKPWQPEAGDRVRIRLRAAAQTAVSCTLMLRRGGRAERTEEIPMTRSEEDAPFVWYEAQLRAGEERLSWYFRLQTGQECVCYTRHGLEMQPQEGSLWNLIPGYRVPEWAVGAVMYQIYVDRFCNGDPSNDVLSGEYQYVGAHSHRVEDWQRLPQADDIRDFYGGDLQGVLDRLDYLAGLGVQAIYLNPLFVSPSNHKYDSQDYEHIDPHYGRIVRDEGALLAEGDGDNRNAERYITRTTDPANLAASDALFAQLVEEAHRRGIRVIIDGVFNHCGSFNKHFDREGIYAAAQTIPGAYRSPDSPYRAWFNFAEDGSYESWWGYETLPKLNYENSEALEEYILGIGRKWVSAPYCADGWRLDVAADLGHSAEYNHSFWKRFRAAVREANPDAIVLAEHYGDSSPWLQGGEWDTIMNYDAFMEPVTWFLTGMEKHSDQYWPELEGDVDSFWKRMTLYYSESFSAAPVCCSMNELSNHDHSRFLTRTNHRIGRVETLGSEAADQDVDRAVFREAVILQMTWMGSPTVYYGDEAGVCGFTDPDNRRTYPWGREDMDLLAFHTQAIRMRRENPALRHGATRLMAAGRGIVAYARFDREETLLIVVNHSGSTGETEAEIAVEPVFAGVQEEAEMERLLLSCADGWSCENVPLTVHEGRTVVRLPERSAAVFRYRKPVPTS